MTAEEFKLCANLYRQINSVLLSSADVGNMDNDEMKNCFENTLHLEETDFFYGTWYGRPVYVAPVDIVKSLMLKRLLLVQEKHQHKYAYYVLARRVEFKEFFRELDMQIALGSL